MYVYTTATALLLDITYTTWYIYMDAILEASKEAAFGFSGPSTRNLFLSQLNTFDGDTMYDYLTWQPSPLLPKWMIWVCMYADGLDIRLRSLRIMDQDGRLTREENDYEEQQMFPPIFPTSTTSTIISPPQIMDVHEITSHSLPI